MTDVPTGWEREGEEITKTFSFPTFPDAVAFVQRVADAAEAADHHPDIDIRYTKVRLALTSHDVGRLTDRDTRLARSIDERCARPS